MVQMSIIKYMGSGPFWKHQYDSWTQPCEDYWWSALLYIQNYYNNNHMVGVMIGSLNKNF